MSHSGLLQDRTPVPKCGEDPGFNPRRFRFLFLAMVSWTIVGDARLHGQIQPAVFERLGTGMDTFPDERFNCLLRGSYGFMWLGSARGLLRYDGSAARWYRHDPDDIQSIASGSVRVLYEDLDRNLWVGTNGGLCLLNRRTGVFTHYRNDPHDAETLSHNNVWSLFQDRNGRLWIGTADGLNRMDNNRILRFTSERGLPGLGITAIGEDGDGNLWIGTEREGLAVYDTRQDRFVADPTAPFGRVRAMHRDPNGRLWVATVDRGLFYRDTGETGWRVFRHDPNDPASLSDDHVTALHTDSKGRLWIGTKRGLNLFLAAQNQFRRFLNDPGDLESLRSNEINGLHCDRDGLVWVATTDAGVDLFNVERSRFRYFELEGNEVWAIHPEVDGPVWVGTKNGLAEVDPQSGVRDWHLRDHVIRAVLPAPDAGFFVGTDHELLVYDPREKNAEPVSLLTEHRIWRIVADPDNGLWLATNRGLLQLSPDTGAIRTFTADPPNEKRLSHNVVSSLALDPSGDLWVGTFGGGLNRMNRATGDFQRYRHRAGEPESIAADDVVDLHLDARGRLWIGTLSGGLNSLDPENGEIRRYTVKSGFPDNAAVAVSSDARGTLWVHTGVGLVNLDPDTDSIVRYRSSDGVAVGSAIPGVCHPNPFSGEIWLGGASGLIGFQPESVYDPDPPEVLFTSFKKGGREVAHLLLPGEAIRLERNDKSFSIEFAVLDFLSRRDQRFAYRRGRIDDGWIPSEGRGFVSYNRYLGYGGEDQLMVRGTNGNGIWHEAALSVTFEPPLWVSWLPLILLAGLAVLAGSIYALVSVREKRRRAKLEAKARLAEEQRAMAEERARIAEGRQELARRERNLQIEHSRVVQDHLERVSTEIANNLHDGPLSELHGLGFRILSLSQSEPLTGEKSELRDLAETSLPRVCHRLRTICGDLLAPDFKAGLETELDAYADVIEDMHPGLTVEREILLNGVSLSREQQAIVYRIFRTLLKNVGKHARATRASFRFQAEERELRLRIEDNGAGFEVPRDWESLKRGKHYGMYMADYFARSLGGSFTVESSPGKGTVVTVTAPLQ